ncbi:type IV pilus assembly PilZ [Desulfobulbus propionicus DSM 2032]|uniref:Type IV pilus assembly PilZ n=1 Tax=Desulfobulbus propionicus (strain ATCC 33891 / DSM 2032 / VKM B-1956 / 1pr3) TaxID=577650 RepID=A0A7U3YL99_DESPD|nr:type IV pilus assembly PilZ [Desulfobulbus propionicus DSM 2032]
MAELKVHVRDNNTATVICPSCGVVKHFAVDQFRHGRHTLSVRCRCQQVFSLLLDFRRHYRKQTSLPGTYEILTEGGIGGGIIHINNISRTGIGFTVSGIHRIEQGQLLLIEFQLNDKNNTVLKKQAVVKTVQHNSIGCEFRCNVEMDKALGFFLQS